MSHFLSRLQRSTNGITVEAYVSLKPKQQQQQQQQQLVFKLYRRCWFKQQLNFEYSEIYIEGKLSSFFEI